MGCRPLTLNRDSIAANHQDPHSTAPSPEGLTRSVPNRRDLVPQNPQELEGGRFSINLLKGEFFQEMRARTASLHVCSSGVEHSASRCW